MLSAAKILQPESARLPAGVVIPEVPVADMAVGACIAMDTGAARMTAHSFAVAVLDLCSYVKYSS